MKRRTIIIAEAGVNHNGNIDIAKKLIDAAAQAGADYVKFQTFKSDLLVSKKAKKANYQKKNTSSSSDSQLEMLRKLELSENDHENLILHCKKRKIKFLSTAFDLESIDYLKNKLDFYKIPSGEITNLPYLRKVATLGLPVIMSTGMASMQEVKDAFEVLTKGGVLVKDITVLHCNTEYPTPMADVNLSAMNTIGEELGVSIGYSDHTLGIEIPIAAVALGANVIEKHFTIDRSLPGPDHKASLEPNELSEMIKSIRNIEVAIGDGIKKPSLSEQKNIEVARKSIVAAKDINIGDIFNEDNLTVKRPGNGISPMLWDDVVNTKANKIYKKDDLIII